MFRNALYGFGYRIAASNSKGRERLLGIIENFEFSPRGPCVFDTAGKTRVSDGNADTNKTTTKTKLRNTRTFHPRLPVYIIDLNLTYPRA